MKRIITTLLTLLVVTLQPDVSGQREIARLVGKELCVMEKFKPREEDDPVSR